MAQTDVSSCVSSILASFTSAIDVFKRVQQSRKRRKRTKARKADATDDHDVRLLGSLTQGPTGIRNEYQRSVQLIGERFTTGDVIAHTTLVEVLMRLNAGLVIIIDQFLRKQDILVDYESLTDLSERARKDTCYTLRQLHQRLLRSPSAMAFDPEGFQLPCRESHARDKSSKSNATTAKPTRVRRRMLAKVVIADSSKPAQIAIVKPKERRKRSKPDSSTGTRLPRVQSKTSLALPSIDAGVSDRMLPTPENHRPLDSHEAALLRRKQSAVEIGNPRLQPRTCGLQKIHLTPTLGTAGQERRSIAESFQKYQSTPALNTRSRQQTPTCYSIESNGTKLGEIPLHKWAQPYDFDAMSLMNKDAMQNGWPVNYDQIEQQRKKKGLGFFRLFRKQRDI